MRQDLLIEAVRRVKGPSGVWYSAFPKIQGHTEIRIRFRTPAGEEGWFDEMVVHAAISEDEALDTCRRLWLKAAEVLFDVRNKTFGDRELAARNSFARTESPAGVVVDIG